MKIDKKDFSDELKKFQEMKRQLAELKKVIPKEALKEIKGERITVLSDEMKKFQSEVLPIMKRHEGDFVRELSKTITTEKPNGNKSLTISFDGVSFYLYIVKKREKKEKK